jgi:acyl-CoA synthetase (AMP-forming)/AMP-acid ligase II
VISTGLAGERSVFLDFLPFFHAYGLAVLMYGGLASGATQVLVPRFDARQCMELIQRHRVTSLFVVPPALMALTVIKESGSFDTSSLEYVMSGAAPLSLELARRAQAAFNTPILEGYGMTETSAVANVTPLASPRPGSVGPPLPDTEEKIVSLDDDRELGPHEEGELCIRGPQVMRGYWQRPAETAAAFTGDGWLRTGDIARCDEDGYVYVVDRKKELIKYKGFQVAPAELEALLLEHPGVLDAAVVPKPDASAGQIPKAFIVASATGRPTPDEILQFVAQRVASYKKLGELEFIDAIPRSLTGKILRRELIERDRAKDG